MSCRTVVSREPGGGVPVSDSETPASSSPMRTTGPTRVPRIAPASPRLSVSVRLIDPEAPARKRSEVQAERSDTRLLSSVSAAPPLPFVTARLDDRRPGDHPNSTPSSGEAKLYPVVERTKALSSRSRHPKGAKNLPAFTYV